MSDWINELVDEKSKSTKKVVESSLRIAGEKSPDDYAKSVQIAENSNLPIDVVERNRPDIESDVSLSQPELQKYLSNSTILSKALSDPHIATLAQDDIKHLSFAENTVRGIKERGLQVSGNFIESVGNWIQMGGKELSDLTGSNPGIYFGDNGIEFNMNLTDDQANFGKVMALGGKSISEEKTGYKPNYTYERLKESPSFTNFVGMVGEQGIKSLPDMAASLINLPGYVLSREQEIAEQRAINKDSSLSVNDKMEALGPAIGLSLLERFASQFALTGSARAVGASGVAKETGKAMVVGSGTEFTQEMMEYAAERIGTEKKLKFKEMVERGFAGALVGGPFEATLRATTATTEAVADTIFARQKEKNAKDSLDSGVQSAIDSKMRQRSPKEYEKLVERFSQGANITVAPEALQQLFQSSPDFAESIDKNAPDVMSDVRESLKTGTDVNIPVSQYMAYFSDKHDALSDSIKVTPDGKTEQEAEEAIADIFKKQDDSETEIDKARASLKQDMFGQLFDIQGRATADTNAEVASLIMSNLANDANISPYELAKSYQLNISKYTPEAFSKPEFKDSLDVMLNRIRSGDIPTEEEANGQPLLKYLRSIGGLKDDGGELAARDLDKAFGDFGKLSQPDGLSMDAAIERILEAGYVQGDTGSFGHNELMDLIDQALNGTNQYSFKNQDSTLTDVRESMQSLENHLDEIGVDIQSATNDEIRAALYGGDTLFQSNIMPDRFDILRAFSGMNDDYSVEDILAIAKDNTGEVSGLYLPDSDVVQELVGDSVSKVKNAALVKLTPATAKKFGKAVVIGEDGKATILLRDKVMPQDDPGVATRVIADAFYSIKNSDPEFIAQRKAETERQERERLTEKYLESHDEMTGDFVKDIRILANHARDFSEFKKLLSADMLDISDRNKTRLARAAIALDSEAETADNIMDVQPAMVEDAAKYGAVYERQAANALADNNKRITVYRAMPNDAKIESGDWVGLVRSYAKSHESNVDGKAATRQKTVSKSDLYWYGADFNEWVYVPKNTWKGYTNLEDVWRDARGNDPLFQRNRGSLKFNNPTEGFKLELTPNADHSTFIHEMAHYYWEVANDLAARTNAPELSSHISAVNKWHKSDLDAYREELRGVAKSNSSQVDIDSLTNKQLTDAIDGVSTLPGLAEIAKVASHERFARGFEAYLREGKSPTPELAGIFARFYGWLLHIYKSMKDLNVELSDDVRSVFDRMLASKEEIDSARERQQYKLAVADFTDLGISKKEAQRINDLADIAKEEQAQNMAAKAYDEGIRSQKKWWKEEKASITEEVEKEIGNLPVYRAIKWLHGEIPDGEKDVRLNKQDLIDEFGKDFIKKLPKGKRAVYSSDGVHPSVIAFKFGYSDYNDMMIDMANAKPFKTVVNAESQRRMEEKYGNMLSDGTLASKAMDAVHSDAQSRVLEAEENALAVKNRKTPTKRQLVKMAAKSEMEAHKVRNIKPFKYQQAESKYGRMAFEAASKGDYSSALEYKRLQIANHERYKAAAKAKDRADKIRARLDKYTKTGTTRNNVAKAGESYIDAIDEIIGRIEFKKSTTLKAIQNRFSLSNFIKEKQAEGENINIPPYVIEDAKSLSYKEITFAQMKEIDESVEQIAHLARTKNKLIIGKEKRDFKEVKAELLSNINGKKSHNNASIYDEDSRVFDLVDSIDAVHSKPEFMFTQMDGETNGHWWKTFFKPLRDATFREVERQAEYAEKTKDIFSNYTPKELYREKVEFGGKMITRDRLISIALNYGNAENKNRLAFTLNKRADMSAPQIDAELMRVMTKRDWQTVQSIWDMIDDFWPEIKESERQRTGRIPERVQPEKVDTPFGTFRGGYYPIKYDSKTSFKQQIFDDKANLADVFANSAITPSTAKGHRETRLREVKRELNLELSVLDNHVNQVIHDLEFFDTLRSLDKLLLDDSINESLLSVLGHEKVKLLRPFLSDVGRGHSSTRDYLGAYDRLAMAMRRNATMVNMGFKLTTAIQQPLGMTQTFAKIGLKYSVKEALDFWSNPIKWKTTTKEVMGKSSMMRNRTKSYDREVNDVLRSAEKRSKGVVNRAVSEVEKYAYSHIAYLDMAVAIPTWKAAYRKAISENQSEQDAVSYADSIVAQTQSSGDIIDLAAIQRNTNTVKLFTMFYSYFSSFYNMMASSSRKVEGKWSEGNKAEAVGYAMFAFTNLVVLPALLAELIVGRGPDEEDDESWSEWAASNVGVYPFMGLVFIRDVANSLFTGYSYSATPIEGAFSALSGASDIPSKLSSGEDISKSDIKNAYLSAGYFTGIPVFNRQGWIMFNNIIGASEGEDLNTHEALMIKEWKD